MGLNVAELKMEVLEKGTLKKLGLINAFSMVTYTKYYNKVGNFQLDCALIRENTEVLKEDNLLWIEGKIVGIIRYVDGTSNNESSMSVQGPLLADILSMRTIWPRFELYDYPEVILKQLVVANCKQGVRDFTKLVVGNVEVTSSRKQNYQQTGGLVADEAEVLCTSYGFGYDVEFIIEDSDESIHDERYILFSIYHGKDRTLGNGANKAVLLGTDFNNLSNSSYSSDVSQYRNYAVVAGEGEGASRKSVNVFIGDAEPTDMDRKEVFIDARDLQMDETSTLATEDEYLELLKQRGFEKMTSEFNKKESYSAEAVEEDRGTSFVFGRDYYLGDRVTVVDEDLSLRLNADVTGVTVTMYNKGRVVEPIFGYETPTIYQKIKKGVI